MKIKKLTFLVLFCGVTLLNSCSQSSSSETDLRKRVRRFELDNGIRVLLLKRDGAPVFSVETKVRVGNIEEVPGSWGLAHFFEHMAFKGTTQINTIDYAKEKPILDEIFKKGTMLVHLKQNNGDPKAIEALQKELAELQKTEDQYITKNEFTEIFQRNGGGNLNASTSNDYTTYYVSMPSNKLELWAYMDSQRFIDPVMREFFTEQQVVAEERRMRIDNQPSGRLYEAFMNKAFDKSPYGVLVIGPPEDIQSYTPDVAKAFYKKYYIPSRMVIAVVGNFDLDDAEAVIKKHFGRIPKKDDPSDHFKGENFDPKTFPRHVAHQGPEKDRFFVGFHRPAYPDKDDVVFDVIKEVLCSGRTSRLVKDLVIDKKIAAGVSCYQSIPGSRLDGLFAFAGQPLKGHTNQEVADEMDVLLKRLSEEGPTDRELQKVKNTIEADLIYSLQSNSGLASQLAFYESFTGNWQYIYSLQDDIAKVTADDVKRVIKTYFVPERRTSAYYNHIEEASQTGAPQ